ncbi:unnamed protein product [Discosporangium mesarthrocarpum]
MGCGPSTAGDRGVAGGSTNTADAADEAASIITRVEELNTKVQLSISCDNISNGGRAANTFVVVSMMSGDSMKWVEVGRTEVNGNDRNPRFVTLISTTFLFEEVQSMRFEAFTVRGWTSADSRGIVPDEKHQLWRAECTLAEIMGSNSQAWTSRCTACSGSQAINAQVTVRAEEEKNSKGMVKLRLRASGLGRGRFFLRISRMSEVGQATPCFKSEVQEGSRQRDVVWREINISLTALSNGDLQRPLLLEVLESNKRSGMFHLVGSCEASVSDLQAKAGQKVPLTIGSEGGGVKGRINCDICEILPPKPSFFDYLAGGVELQFVVAIDYTASNGDPMNPGSLHHLDPSGRRMNEYEHAMHSIGNVLQFYDADKLFPVFGFGGCPDPRMPPEHCFAVNGMPQTPEVHGVSGVLEIYRHSLSRVKLSGPTLFAPVINQVAKTVAETRSLDKANQTYTILLLMTDGVINDMSNTLDALVAAADLPFSVIIVGVGQQDFTSMEILDGDDERITNTLGKKASRDIVQFVPMRDFRNRSTHALAKEVLAEIPRQLVDYMAVNNIPPCSPQPPDVPNVINNRGSGYSAAGSFHSSGVYSSISGSVHSSVSYDTTVRSTGSVHGQHIPVAMAVPLGS